MTFSIFRSKWVFGTSISMSTTIASFRTSFFHFSIKAPPFPLLYRKRGILLKFFDRLKRPFPGALHICIFFVKKNIGGRRKKRTAPIAGMQRGDRKSGG